jgi:hypothetical protein
MCTSETFVDPNTAGFHNFERRGLSMNFGRKIAGLLAVTGLALLLSSPASAVSGHFFVSLTSGGVTDTFTTPFTADENDVVNLSGVLSGVTLVAGNATASGFSFGGITDPFYFFSASGQVNGTASFSYGFIAPADCPDFFIAGDSLGITLSPGVNSSLSVTPVYSKIQRVFFLGGGDLDTPGSLDIGTAISHSTGFPPTTAAFSFAAGPENGTGPITDVVLLGDFDISGQGAWGLSGSVAIECVIPEPGSVTTLLVGAAVVGGGLLRRRRMSAR